MFEKKHTVTVLTFLVLSTTLISFSFSGEWDGGVYRQGSMEQERRVNSEDSYLKSVEYFVLKENKPLFALNSDDLTLNSSKEKSFFINPKGLVYTDGGQKVNYEGLTGVFDQKTETLILVRNVVLKTQDTEAVSNKMIYQAKNDRVHLTGEVKTKTFHAPEGDWIYIDSEEAYFWPQSRRSKYLGQVKGLIKRKKVYEDSMNFESSELYLDMTIHKADLTHDVVIKKQNLTATSRRGEIFLENYNKKLKYFALYDDVKVIEKVMLDGKFIRRKAFSEKLEGLPSEEKIILTGYPKVYQLSDVIKGNRIVLRENTEVVEVDDANSNFKVE
jgi:lipopolysaccharide export system protein LptA